VGPAGPEVSAALIAFLGGDFKNNAKNKLRAQAGMEPASPLFIEGFRVLSGSGDEANLEIYAHVPRGQGPSGTFAYSITATASVSAAGAIDIEAFRREPIVAHQLNVNLLQQDPPSAAGQHTIAESRANRSPLELAPFAVPTVLPGLPPGPGPKLLVDDLGQVEVRESDLLNGDPTVVHTATAPPRDPRSDDFSALSTYMHARGLLDRMRAYGFVPNAYFQFARFPVIVRYRTTIPAAPRDDGRTVNAAVDYDPPRADFGQGWGPPDLREPLQIRYALGDVKRSAGPAPRRHALLNPAPDREPLGIAADPRWSWHEFGHLLLAASTGGLELPFVHSVGDALAAIACDPDSRLADAHLNGEYRGLTFPWVHAGRRHDRDPYLGWSWCGTYHRPLRFPPYTNNAQRKGYHSEQILSSSLFRLYRALGGDTVDAAGNPDQAARLRAAEYVIYLIMRAIHELPPAVAGAAETAQQFMEGLVRADVNTLPAVGGPLDRRVGGWAHKVIRWAFEAQGLDRNVPDDVINNAPGRPENVDLFIDTRRPNAQGPFTRGGYVPVSLHWGGPVQQLWLALNTLQGMQVTPQGLRVRVRNRVGSAVNNVRVRAWSARAQPNLPDWDPAAWAGPTLVWSELGNSPSPQLNVPAGGRLFGPFINLPAQPGRYVLLAAILSAQDEPNINPGAVFPVPTAFNPTPLVDLVAGDNNLGLLVYDVP
jgi:hypothetical protein